MSVYSSKTGEQIEKNVRRRFCSAAAAPKIPLVEQMVYFHINTRSIKLFTKRTQYIHPLLFSVTLRNFKDFRMNSMILECVKLRVIFKC